MSKNRQLRALKPSEIGHRRFRQRPVVTNQAIPSPGDTRVLAPSGPAGAACPNRAESFPEAARNICTLGSGRANNVKKYTTPITETLRQMAPSVPAKAEDHQAGNSEPQQNQRFGTLWPAPNEPSKTHMVAKQGIESSTGSRTAHSNKWNGRPQSKDGKAERKEFRERRSQNGGDRTQRPTTRPCRLLRRDQAIMQYFSFEQRDLGASRCRLETMSGLAKQGYHEKALCREQRSRPPDPLRAMLPGLPQPPNREPRTSPAAELSASYVHFWLRLRMQHGLQTENRGFECT